MRAKHCRARDGQRQEEERPRRRKGAKNSHEENLCFNQNPFIFASELRVVAPSRLHFGPGGASGNFSPRGEKQLTRIFITPTLIT